MKILIAIFLCISINAQALNCPSGTQEIKGTCKLVVNDKEEKTQMIKKLFEEGVEGETHHAVVEYTEKLLGKNALKNIKDINPNYKENTQSWFSRLWLKITGEKQGGLTSAKDKSYMKKVWQSIFKPDTSE